MVRLLVFGDVELVKNQVSLSESFLEVRVLGHAVQSTGTEFCEVNSKAEAFGADRFGQRLKALQFSKQVVAVTTGPRTEFEDLHGLPVVQFSLVPKISGHGEDRLGPIGSDEGSVGDVKRDVSVAPHSDSALGVIVPDPAPEYRAF